MSRKHKITYYPLLVILGPTGSGKSDLAVKLARRFNGELVSADSRQVYKGMDVATNKLKAPQGVRQWLIDVAAPDRCYSLAQYQKAALKVIKDIHSRGKLPILVGGTGLYIDAVAENWQIPKVAASRSLRRQLGKDLKDNGLAVLAQMLKHIDPKSAQAVDLKNPRRVIRALEVVLVSGESFINIKKKGSPLFNVFKIGLMVDRNNLRERLQKRAVSMARKGLAEETRKLLKKYGSNILSMSGIGYTEAAAYIHGLVTRKEMIERIVMRSMQYARRQMTWWKRDKSIVWIKRPLEASELVSRWAALKLTV